MKSGVVISDMHIFAERSNADQYMATLHVATKNADFLVLNGDIFDFKWSSLSSIGETIVHAVTWLDTLSKAHPHCTVFFIMGNHDDLASFAQPLNRLSEDVENFFWHPTHVRIDNALYLHGDLPLKGKNPFERNLEPMKKMKRDRLHILYKGAVRSRLHRVPELFITKSICATRMLSVFRKYPHTVLERITDIYFGHTHVAFTDFKFKGYKFHNTGATIRGVKSNMMRISVSKEQVGH